MNGFLALLGEAIQDAFRRRIVFAIVVLSMLTLFMIDGCTSCATGEVMVNGETQELPDIAGAAGVNLFVWTSLWIIVLAGVLASDHLQQTLDDGSAELCLARPISRHAFVLSRLVGALAVAWAAGAVLLGTTAAWLASRSGLPLGPAALAEAAGALGTIAIAALAMTASLWLPRLATLLLVFGFVMSTGAANLVAYFNEEGGGSLGWWNELGPPLAAAMIRALDPWVVQVEVPGDPLGLGLRLLAWTVGAVVLLLVAFRRVEIRS